MPDEPDHLHDRAPLAVNLNGGLTITDMSSMTPPVRQVDLDEIKDFVKATDESLGRNIEAAEERMTEALDHFDAIATSSFEGVHARLDDIAEKADRRHDETKTSIRNHRDRIESLEDTRMWAAIILAIVLIGSAVIGFIAVTGHHDSAPSTDSPRQAYFTALCIQAGGLPRTWGSNDYTGITCEDANGNRLNISFKPVTSKADTPSTTTTTP